jgi:4-amino-4-deoxy-L-arabinose transferase-like glycosyltransferase
VTKVHPGPAARLEAAPPASSAGVSWTRRFLRGRTDDPAWVRPQLLALLAGTAVLYSWDLGGAGWANAFYSAAVQAGSHTWKGFFFGSFDGANAITVDKAPGALWVMELSVRLFGLSSWSLLLPQALMGVATVGVLYLTVRRAAGPAAGLLAGVVTALTPVAVLMFRFNNPDTLLTLLLTLAAYAVTRALETAAARWMVGAGILLGLGFLTKTLQVLLVVPGFALVYLVAAPTTVGKRVAHLLGAGAAMVVAGGWWLAIVQLVPKADRPYVGGSQTDSVWELIWGYNGLGRLNGQETGSVTKTPGGGWGPTGVLRMFTDQIGGQVSWLLPAALVGLAVGLVLTRRAARTDRLRAALLLWGSWLLITGLTFSLMAGIFHPYYTVALAPAIGALAGMGARLLWMRRNEPWAACLAAATLAGTAAWAWVLLDRSPHWLPFLRSVIIAAGLVAATGTLAHRRLSRRSAAAVLVAGCIALLGGPAVYAIRTASAAHIGAIPSAGPTLRTPTVPVPPAPVARPRPGAPLGAPRTGPGGLFVGLPVPSTKSMGTLTRPSLPSPAVTKLLDRDASSYTWVVATVGAERAAGFQLASGHPALPLGGFNGSDPFPSPEQFRADVAAHRVHWFVGGTDLAPSTSGSDQAHEIAAWVESHYVPTIVDGVTLYDVSRLPAA